MKVTIDHPTGQANFSIVTIGEVDLAFSYRTIVGFADCGRWYISENLWGPITGKHLNQLPNSDKARRLPRENFDALLAATLAPFGSEVTA